MKRCFREKVVHVLAGLVVLNLFACAGVTEQCVSLVDDGKKKDPIEFIAPEFCPNLTA